MYYTFFIHVHSLLCHNNYNNNIIIQSTNVIVVQSQPAISLLQLYCLLIQERKKNMVIARDANKRLYN